MMWRTALPLAVVTLLTREAVWQVAELRAERDRLLNDKSSLHSQVAELREHYASIGLASSNAAGQLGSLRASQEAESARAEALARVQAAQLSHERATQAWILEKQQLQVWLIVTASAVKLITCPLKVQT